MIIDSHNHPDWHGHDLKKFIENMDKNGIDKTWLLTWESPDDEFAPLSVCHYPAICKTGPISFERCLSYIERAPDRFVLGYAPDPREPGAINKLRSAVTIYGVKVCGEIKLRMMYDNPDAIRMYRYCGENGIPVVMHFDYELGHANAFPWPNYWYGGGIDVLERVLLACPETNFLGHAPGFWAHISNDGQFDKVAYPKGPVIPGGRIHYLLDKYPNLYCDISAGSGRNALTRDPEHAKKFLVDYQDRILFARDYFDSDHFNFLESLALPADVMEKIYSGNSLKLAPCL